MSCRCCRAVRLAFHVACTCRIHALIPGASALHQPPVLCFRILHAFHVSRAVIIIKKGARRVTPPLPRSSLADAFNTLTRKFVYAGERNLQPLPRAIQPPHPTPATIVPLHELETAPAIPEGSTPSPFVVAAPPPPPPATSRLAKLEAAAADILASSSYSRWGQPGQQGRGGHGRKRRRNDRYGASVRVSVRCK